jgi:hypothetical protein
MRFIETNSCSTLRALRGLDFNAMVLEEQKFKVAIAIWWGGGRCAFIVVTLERFKKEQYDSYLWQIKQIIEDLKF